MYTYTKKIKFSHLNTLKACVCVHIYLSDSLHLYILLIKFGKYTANRSTLQAAKKLNNGKCRKEY